MDATDITTIKILALLDEFDRYTFNVNEKANILKEIRELIESNEEVLNNYAEDEWGDYVPLYFLIIFNFPELCTYILTYHINLNCYSTKYGFTLLHYVVHRCIDYDFKIDYFKKIVKLINKKSDGKGISLNTQDYAGNTAIHYLVSQNDKQAIARFNYLKNNGASLHIPNYKGAIPLHYAVASGFKCIEDLINSDSVYSTDSYNLHPLDYIVFYRSSSNSLSSKYIINLLSESSNSHNQLGITISGHTLKEFMRKHLDTPKGVLEDFVLNAYALL